MSVHSHLPVSADIIKAPSTRGRVYLVDDNSDMRRSLHILNKLADIEPQTFPSVVQFLDALPMLAPAPVLFKIAMSPTDGIALLRELAAWKISWPIIVMIGPGETAMAEGVAHGPITVLVKPFSAGELKLAVGSALDAMPEGVPHLRLPAMNAEDAKDIAEQKVAEYEVDKFRQARGPFVVAAEATRMAMVFTNARSEGSPIIFANDSFLALTGYTCAEVVGQSFNFLMSGMADAKAMEEVRAQFALEITETIEVECRRRDGHPFLAAIRINPVHDKAGKTIQHCISFVSLSAHDERVQKEREALHALYQHTPDFIVTMEGPEHRFTFANDAYQRLTGNRASIGEAVGDALPEVVGQGFVALLDRVFATGEAFVAKGMPITLDGKTGLEARFVDFMYQAVRGTDGEITGIFCEGHDATEQKLATDQVQSLKADLTKATRASAMGTMAATLAHELNQPLAAILNYAGACERLIDPDGQNAAKLDGAVTGISAGARRAAEIIRRLRDMSEERTAHRELFDLKDAIRESIALVQAAAWVRVAIDDSDCHSVEIEADRVQIEQVIMNLLRNACEAVVSEHGRVTISAHVKGRDAVVSVQDNGPGVALRANATLFERSGSTKPQGMGVGLSICRDIIEAHQGAIWLESGSGGANFRFSLPLAHDG